MKTRVWRVKRDTNNNIIEAKELNFETHNINEIGLIYTQQDELHDGKLIF